MRQFKIAITPPDVGAGVGLSSLWKREGRAPHLFVESISVFLLGRSRPIAGWLRRTTVTLVLLVSAIVFATLDMELP